MQSTLSVLILAERAGKQLHNCISKVENIAAEIVIIGKEKKADYKIKAGETAVKVYGGKWSNGYGTVLRYLIGQANSDWILMLNCCEELCLGSAKNLFRLMDNKDINAYYLKVANPAEKDDELPLNADMSLRLIKKNKYDNSGATLEEILDSILDLNSAIQTGIAEDPIIYCREYNNLKSKQNTLLCAIAQEPEKLSHRYYLGLVYYKQNRFDMALNCFLHVYQHRTGYLPYLPDLMRKIAISYYAIDDMDKSLCFMDNEWPKIYPQTADIHYIKGVIHKKTGDYLEAHKSFTRFLSLSEEKNEFTSCLNVYDYSYKVFYYLGNLAEYFMNIDQSLKYYYKSLNCNPYMVVALEKIISILKPRQNPEYTFGALNQIFDLSDKKIQENLAFIFYKEGAYRLALASLQNMGNRAYTFEKNRLLKGLCLLREGLFDEAVIELGTVRKDRRLFIKAQQYLLLYYKLLDDETKMKNCMEKIKSFNSNSLLVKLLTVFSGAETESLTMDTDNEQAQLIIREILEFAVEMGDTLFVDGVSKNLQMLIGTRPCLLLAELFYKYEKYDLAIKEYSQLLEFGKTDARTIYYLGKSYWGIGNLIKAQFYLRQASEQGLNIPRLNWELINLYQQLAIEKLEAEIRGCPRNSKLVQSLDHMRASWLQI